MNHRSFRKLVSAYRDGELEGRDRAAAEQHMQSCPECRAYLTMLQETGSVLKEAGVLNLDEVFTAHVMRSVRSDEELSMTWLPVERFARRLVVGLSLVVVVFVTVSMMSRPQDPVIIETYLTGEHPDSSITRTLLTKEDLSKDDVLFAAVSRK